MTRETGSEGIQTARNVSRENLKQRAAKSARQEQMPRDADKKVKRVPSTATSKDLRIAARRRNEAPELLLTELCAVEQGLTLVEKANAPGFLVLTC